MNVLLQTVKRLMASGGMVPPLNRRKISEKKANATNMIFRKCHQNPLGQLLKEFLKLYQL